MEIIFIENKVERFNFCRKRTTLTINNFGPDDVGSYTCSGLSVTGNASADFRIRVDKNDVRKIAKKGELKHFDLSKIGLKLLKGKS